MKRKMIDSHTHSKRSHDGHVKIRAMLDEAKKRGFRYLAITEHCDWDYSFCHREKYVRKLDLKKYEREFFEAKRKAGEMQAAFGIELGYSELAEPLYRDELKDYKFDVIINSVHTLFGKDAYFRYCFEGRNRDEVYGEYLRVVLASVKADFSYDIIGHFGYITRYAPYEPKSLYTPEFYLMIDEILKEIIARGKTLELNSNVKKLDVVCHPERAILERYRALGGENITFSSDAHRLKRLGDGYGAVAELAKSVGFTDWTVYLDRKPVKIKI